MILFFGNPQQLIYAVETNNTLDSKTIDQLTWLFSGAQLRDETQIEGNFVGPRAAMVSPWSTNAVEITQNMGIKKIKRIEIFEPFGKKEEDFDPMTTQKFNGLNQSLFETAVKPDKVKEIDDIALYNQQEGLALSDGEIDYLNDLSGRLNRKLTDSEVFGFSQVNSEHCRHKIFNGTFVIDGEEMKSSLFQMIKKTSEKNPNGIVSAYKDNVAFVDGPKIQQFAPKRADVPDFYQNEEFDSVISLKAETHNFPTTVEPFNGAATGSGGEIRDRLAGGRGSLPLAGTAVYMTSYSRLGETAPFDSASERQWENGMEERDWLYQKPVDILIKASNGASDFGNKFGQPLISGSVLTFEHQEGERALGYDKVIMLAGGVGYGKKEQAIKSIPKKGDEIVVMGGENYRIGMGGAAVSSADTGKVESGIELNAVQRSNPEMQKRVANAVRGMVENEFNGIASIHDHGAGGHLNCLSELVEETGGKIDLDKLPIGDPTLSAKEIIGNESQERMGIAIDKKQLEFLKRLAKRERAPLYEVGHVTEDFQFTFQSEKTGEKPLDLAVKDMFGSSPKAVMTDKTMERHYENLVYETDKIYDYFQEILQLEAVACKDWLTNKVDRCVTGRVAKQQTAGSLQLPLNNCGVMALDYRGLEGVATSIGHSPISALIDPVAGSKNSLAEALTNIVWAPLKDGLNSVSLSANWMWPCNSEGEDARLYKAVEGLSEFAINLGINIPTGKDSLSMKQKYEDSEVISPGTVIISASGHCNSIQKTVEPVFQKNSGSIYYLNFSQDDLKLGGSSFSQILGAIGNEAPTVKNDEMFIRYFNAVQGLVTQGHLAAGHDIASGGFLTSLMEMCFADKGLGAEIDLSEIPEDDWARLLFNENAGVIIQAKNDAAIEEIFVENKLEFFKIGELKAIEKVSIWKNDESLIFDVNDYRKHWFHTSLLLDQRQSGKKLAKKRFDNLTEQPLKFKFPKHFDGKSPVFNSKNPRPKAAILREKGSNSEREMARALHVAGFDVKDVHMTDLTSGRENLENIQFLAAVGGFSNSDVLGSAKGWAGAIRYNEKANTAIANFFKRGDTLSIGVCNGCQLFIELGLLHPAHDKQPKMLHNDSHKFECRFTSIDIPENNSVMLKNLAGSSLGIWAAHGEGKFDLPYGEKEYKIVGEYGYSEYPFNPNGSDFNTAMMTDASGRHLVTMPHLERSSFPWNWAHYPDRKLDEVSPWIQAFVNAREWICQKNKK
jgi:phosphoribosylformylglycinamidine synthase